MMTVSIEGYMILNNKKKRVVQRGGGWVKLCLLTQNVNLSCPTALLLFFVPWLREATPSLHWLGEATPSLHWLGEATHLLHWLGEATHSEILGTKRVNDDRISFEMLFPVQKSFTDKTKMPLGWTIHIRQNQQT